MDGWYYIGLFLVFGVIGPAFWLLALSASLWIGRKCLSERHGQILFGHYWKQSRLLERRGNGRAG